MPGDRSGSSRRRVDPMNFVLTKPPPSHGQMSLDLGDIPLSEPHQQSRHQYESDPRTVWHAEGAETMASSPSSILSITAGGLHVGTRAAAQERGQDLADRLATMDPAKLPGGSLRPIRMFSGRLTLTGPRGGAKYGNSPNIPGRDEGQVWTRRKKTHFYRNEGEDEGSISAQLPGREGHITTHRESVLSAVQMGKDVHPNIRWEAEHSPEWSGTIERTPSKPEPQPEMLHHVSFGSTSIELTPQEHQQWKESWEQGGPIKAKLGQKVKAFR